MSAQISGGEALIMHLRSDLNTLEKLIDLFVCHLLAELCQDVSELASADKSVTLLVEHLESSDKFL